MRSVARRMLTSPRAHGFRRFAPILPSAPVNGSKLSRLSEHTLRVYTQRGSLIQTSGIPPPPRARCGFRGTSHIYYFISSDSSSEVSGYLRRVLSPRCHQGVGGRGRGRGEMQGHLRRIHPPPLELVTKTPPAPHPLFSFVEDAQVRFFFATPSDTLCCLPAATTIDTKASPVFFFFMVHCKTRIPTCGSKWTKKKEFTLGACFIVNHPSHPPTPLLVLHSLTFQGSYLAIAFIPELISQILVETSDSVEWLFDLILLYSRLSVIAEDKL